MVMHHPIFGKPRQMTVADALRDISDDMLLTLVLAEVERRGLDPDAFGNRIARMGSEAARLMMKGRKMTDPVEILARELCAQESEIWEEAGLAYRKRWRNEAAAKLRADAMLAAREGKE